MSAMNLDLCPRCKKLYFECETILPNGELGCSCGAKFWLAMRDQVPATPLSKRHPNFAQAQREAERLCRVSAQEGEK